MNHLLSLLLLATFPLTIPAWEIRYAHQPDQTPEWTRMGRVPAFTVSVEEQTVAFADATDGRCRGWVFVARPLRLPERPPVRILAEMEFQTFCSIDTPHPRSGLVYLFLATPEAWKSLADAPEQGRPFAAGHPPKGMLIAKVRGHGPDVLEWITSGAVLFSALPESMRREKALMAGVALGDISLQRGTWRVPQPTVDHAESG